MIYTDPLPVSWRVNRPRDINLINVKYVPEHMEARLLIPRVYAARRSARDHC